jgi:hypothetical protein
MKISELISALELINAAHTAVGLDYDVEFIDANGGRARDQRCLCLHTRAAYRINRRRASVILS